MMIVNGEYDIALKFEENAVSVLCMENPRMFSSAIHSLWNQINGMEGNWILSESEKMLNISKKIDCIFNPFSVDYNDRKVLNKLYQELLFAAQGEYYESFGVMNSEIINLLTQLLQTQPYRLDIRLDLDIVGLLKLYEVKFETEDVDLLDKMITYIKIMHQVCGIEIFTFINLKSYLTEMEIVQLYKSAFYEKVYLWLVENRYSRTLSDENVVIFDKDLCIIKP
ncbi:MAG: type II-A CRISPR-associated protein Csn2 [Lachnospiraceae bacterium]|nr:type II-A CRISPR-associated protein Csn2 [Lachnospiraceae bacterium]